MDKCCTSICKKAHHALSSIGNLHSICQRQTKCMNVAMAGRRNQNAPGQTRCRARNWWQARLQCASVQCDAAIGAVLGQLPEEVWGQEDGGRDCELEQQGPSPRPVGLAGVDGDSLTCTNLTAAETSRSPSNLLHTICRSFGVVE